MPKSFAQKVRDIIGNDLADRQEFTCQDIALRLDLVTNKEKKPIFRSLSDLIKRGEVVRVSPGVYRSTGRNRDVQPADKTRCMFKLIRANRRETITVSDLMANCDVAKTTAGEYLAMMVNRGILRAIKPVAVNRPYRYQMIDDPGPNLIRNEENAEKLRRLREVKALANEALAAIQENLDVAVAAVAAIEEE